MLKRMAQMAMHLTLRLKMLLLTDLLSVPKVLVERWRAMRATRNSALVGKVEGQNKIPSPLRTTSILCQEKEADMSRRGDELREVANGQEKANVLPPEVVNNTICLYLAGLVCTISS
jgi:hypothetical protein